MNREELMDKLEEIQDRNNATFLGSNESELHQREDIANLFESQTKELQAEIERLTKEVSIARNLVGLSNLNDLKETILNKNTEIEKLKGDNQNLRNGLKRAYNDFKTSRWTEQTYNVIEGLIQEFPNKHWSNPQPQFHIDALRTQLKILYQLLKRFSKEDRKQDMADICKEIKFLKTLIYSKAITKKIQ